MRHTVRLFETYPPSSLLLAAVAVVALIDGVPLHIVLIGTVIYALGQKLDMWGLR